MTEQTIIPVVPDLPDDGEPDFYIDQHGTLWVRTTTGEYVQGSSLRHEGRVYVFADRTVTANV